MQDDGEEEEEEDELQSVAETEVEVIKVKAKTPKDPTKWPWRTVSGLPSHPNDSDADCELGRLSCSVAFRLD